LRKLTALLAPDADERLDILERQAKLEPSPGMRRALLGEAADLARARGQLDRALGLWQERLAADANDRKALARTIEILEGAERWQELVVALARRASADVPWIQRRADLMRVAEVERDQLKNPANAIAALSQILETAASDAGAGAAILDLFAAAGRWQDLLNLGTRVGQGTQGELVALFVRLGDACRAQLADPQGAATWYARALAVDPRTKGLRDALLAWPIARRRAWPPSMGSCAAAPPPTTGKACWPFFPTAWPWPKAMANACASTARPPRSKRSAPSGKTRPSPITSRSSSFVPTTCKPRPRSCAWPGHRRVRLAAKSIEQASAGLPPRPRASIPAASHRRPAFRRERGRQARGARLRREGLPGRAHRPRRAAHRRAPGQLARGLANRGRGGFGRALRCRHVLVGDFLPLMEKAASGASDAQDSLRTLGKIALRGAGQEGRCLGRGLAAPSKSASPTTPSRRTRRRCGRRRHCLRARDYDPSHVPTLRRLAEAQRGRGGKPLYETLVQIAALAPRELDPLVEALDVAEQDKKEPGLARAVLTSLFDRSAGLLRAGQAVEGKSTAADCLVRATQGLAKQLGASRDKG
jgi:hypothetical protein